MIVGMTGPTRLETGPKPRHHTRYQRTPNYLFRLRDGDYLKSIDVVIEYESDFRKKSPARHCSGVSYRAGRPPAKQCCDALNMAGDQVQYSRVIW
jgi:hypothetical protein